MYFRMLVALFYNKRHAKTIHRCLAPLVAYCLQYCCLRCLLICFSFLFSCGNGGNDVVPRFSSVRWRIVLPTLPLLLAQLLPLHVFIVFNIVLFRLDSCSVICCHCVAVQNITVWFVCLAVSCWWVRNDWNSALNVCNNLYYFIFLLGLSTNVP